MFKLIKNELFKIFHKKSTIILMSITILFSVLVNYIYSNDFNTYVSGYYYGDDNAQEFVDNFDPEVDSYEDLAYYETELDIQKLSSKYENNAWQNTVLYDEYYSVANNYYYMKYFGDEEDLTLAKAKYDEMLNALKTDNWKYFVNIRINDTKESISNLEKSIAKETIEKNKVELQKELFIEKERLELLQYRIDNDLVYGSDYLNNAIDEIEFTLYDVVSYEMETDKSVKARYEDSVKSYHENKYILETKEDTKNEQSARGVLMNLMSEYYFLILVFVVMIGGSMVSDEFNKGTIKSLLIAPFSRSKILLAKFLSTLIMIPVFICFVLLVQFIMGSIFFGFSSLSIPVVVYNIAKSSLEVVGLFKYLVLTILANLPMIILLATLAFAASTIIGNTAFAIAITFCGLIGSEIINSFALVYNLKFLNYFVTTNWDFTYYLFGGSSMYGNSLLHAALICLLYFAIMVVLSFVVFKRKDIKNI